jgi:glutamate/aspartate transport system permease protein
MRSIPLILTIFGFYFLVPSLLAWMTGAREPIPIDAFWTSVIAFIVFEAAYYCEIIRAGIRSVGRGQSHASEALGMTMSQTMVYVVLPQALRVMIPVLLTQTVLLFQDVSLVYVLSITDFVGAASKIAERDARLPELYLFVAVVYFAMSLGLSFLAGRLRRSLSLGA